ncbi:LOW QUALITY PROTEIN: zinc finger protein 644 [Sphaeramia orbicularis]|uniref:LOW QUALITY PROTEIN: zinc finger protein 644 n=1 Tax=Sphaeramia orbicularis TaxID=375764 RepID=UPI00117E1E10|nr:LOW QUALITY PROTEIN: zinc finger protein 644-like [Sphaeramia orbicularis]
MSKLKPKAQKDKDVELRSDSPGRTQEPFQSHTFSLKNNVAGLSSDEHENPLNGTQPKPFVYSSAPAVPHADNSLPSGALVNGPGSHPTSEVHSVLNKGTVFSNNVLDAAWQPEKDTSTEVLLPPGELQSDAWMNPAGHVVKTLATQPGVDTPLSHSEENESKLAYSTLSGDSADQMHISRLLTKQTIKTRSQRDSQWSQSSSDDYDDDEVIRWDLAKKRRRFMQNDRRLETNERHQRDWKHKTHAISMSDTPEKVNCSLNHTYMPLCSSNNVENVDIAHKDDSFDSSCSTAEAGCNEGSDHEDEDSFSSTVKQLKSEQLEDPLFFSCTICNVNFKEKRHFHRHTMMYHLGKHNQVNSENVSQPFICRECGRLFCDSNSLMKHIIIHQDRLEKLMKRIKGLKNTESEDQGTAVQCPQCVYGCNCPKIFVQHARTHDNLTHYYFCEECNFITLTQEALEAHLEAAHLNMHQHQYRKMAHASDAQETQDHAQCEGEACFFTTGDGTESGRHPEQEHQQLHCVDYKKFSEQPRNLFKPNSPQVKCHVGCTKNKLSPSLWKIDKHGNYSYTPRKIRRGKLISPLQKKNTIQAMTERVLAVEQTNCSDFLLSAGNLKLDQMFSQESSSDPTSTSSKEQANQNSLSISKMSTPWQNTIDSMNGSILPKLSQRLKKQTADGELVKGCEGSTNFSNDTSEATASFLESSGNERNSYAWRYFTKTQRFSAKDKSPRVLQDEGEDCSDIEQLIIKEEYIETTVDDHSPQSPSVSTSPSFDLFPLQEAEYKSCPYCPAMFESGVGLSNHVRGHLHRVGLSYNARHMVSPEQVAMHDCQPRIRRRISHWNKEVKPETQKEHTCPLCYGWFDTKTGLSNHVRGHLKRMGRSVSGHSKSPLRILNELLQDNKKHRTSLQNQLPSQPCVSQKLISRNDFFLMHTGIPVQIQCAVRNPSPILESFVPKQEVEEFSEKKKVKLEEEQRGTEALASTLVELLETKQESMKLLGSDGPYASMKLCNMTKDCLEETRVTSTGPDWLQGENASNTLCIQCNNTFPNAVCLSGHLQAYARRSRIGILEKTCYDYKQKLPRPRPGLKRKTLPSLNTEIYTLTCRFCDLVFQGPLSVQEDWIRHLQRHLLHTSVPHSGTGMVEVLDLHHKIHLSLSHEQPAVD